MKSLINGLIIGIGKILPGISGSVLAISLGEYKKIINSFNDLKNKDNLFYLIKIIGGVLISIILFSKILLFFMKKNNSYMYAFFVGLIIGTIPSIIKKNKNKIIFYSFLGFCFFILISMIKIKLYCGKNVKAIIIGFIESISTIIPGISGTALLSNFGLYNSYLEVWSNIYNVDFLLDNYKIYILFCLSVIITSIILLKIINRAFTNHEEKTNGVVLGFVIASIIVLLKNITIDKTFISIFLNIIIIILGTVISYYLNKLVI